MAPKAGSPSTSWSPTSRSSDRLSAGAGERYTRAMTANDAALLPDDLPALRRWLAARPDAADLFDLPIREVVVRSDALLRLPGLLADLDAPARVLLIQDDRAYARAGADL